MSATFAPRVLQRTHCVCGAARVAHHPETLACPEAYRPGTMAEALRELAAAQASGNSVRVFSARGEVQRLLGHRTGTCWPLCAGYIALRSSKEAT